MNIISVFILQLVFTSSNIPEKDFADSSYASSSCDIPCTKKYHETLFDFFNKFEMISGKEFLIFKNGTFKRLQEILGQYHIVSEKNYIIPLFEHLKNKGKSKNMAKVIYGHRYPNFLTFSSLKEDIFYLREGISNTRILDIKNSMINLQRYDYSNIFKFVKNDNLLYHVVLTSLVENMGIVYLRILTEVPYYRTDKFFIRDFIVHSASFLHSVNVIYKAGLNDHRVMNVFKVFVAKNLKLLCIFYNAWILSYEFITKKIDDHQSIFLIPYFSLKVDSKIDSDVFKCSKLDAFNFEMQSLFQVFIQNNLDPKFKKEFEVLKMSRKFVSSKLNEIIDNLDQECILKFFTKNFTENRSPLYFLNNLDIKIPITDDELARIKTRLFFITNENIKKYCIKMCLIAYADNDIQSKNFIGYFLNKRKAEIIGEEVLIKRQREINELTSKQDTNVQLNSDVKHDFVQPFIKYENNFSNFLSTKPYYFNHKVEYTHSLKQRNEEPKDENPLDLSIKK